MKIPVRKILGLLLSVAALAFFVYGIYRVARGGTCASGGAYVSTKQCAPDSTAWMFALPVAVLVGLFGLWLARGAGTKPDPVAPQPLGAPVPGYSTTVTSTGGQAALIEALLSRGAQVYTTDTTAQPAQDPVAQLEKLQALLAAGALTPEEYERAKARVLAQM